MESEVERAGQPVALDLEEVDLADIDGVRFLNECEAAGIPVLQCSPYVREWMQRERDQQNRPPKSEGDLSGKAGIGVSELEAHARRKKN